MEVNINNNAANWGVRQETLDSSQVSKLASRTVGEAQSSATGSARLFTITQSLASPEDVAAAGISEAALTRDDPLGNLIGEAFCLPPPPMPHFET